jgi:isoquinoline 1-oxidoreductase subunit beta
MTFLIKNLSRRRLLQGAAAGTALLSLGVFAAQNQAGQRGASQGKKSSIPGERLSAWITIGTDGKVDIYTSFMEMGQGALTTTAQIVAEELDVAWSDVRVHSGSANDTFKIVPRLGTTVQLTGGSRTQRVGYPAMRKAGASARAMLMAAAAERWKVPVAELKTRDGFVLHGRQKLAYSELVEAAAKFPAPADPPLKDPTTFRYIGKDIKRLDSASKTNGSAIFGIDFTMPGMLTAVVARSPVIGGKVKSFDSSAALAITGVKHVVQIPAGVAVVATSMWTALKGRDALKVQWEDGALATFSTDNMWTQFARAAKEEPVAVMRNDGNIDTAFGSQGKTLQAEYFAPLLNHAALEPMSCAAHVTKDARSCEVWVATQGPTFVQQAAMRITGLPAERVKVNTLLMGGAFGRKFADDFVEDALFVANQIEAPVKVVRTREDDMRSTYYRQATYNTMRASLDGDGNPVGWEHRIVGPSLMFFLGRTNFKDNKDPVIAEGAINLPYAIPNLRVDYVWRDLGFPVWPWRTVGSSVNGFVTESFIDEMAHAAGKDPYQFRRALLAKHPRLLAVLDLAAQKAEWGKSKPGVFKGIAAHECFEGWVAQVAEVSVNAGQVKVHRIVCASDAGFIINPDIVRAQAEGGVLFGLSAALREEITIDGGRVKQGNFHEYPILRYGEAPQVEVHLIDSKEKPGGAGEPPLAPVAAAVCNAVFAATGKRIRRLPIGEQLKI